VTISWQDKAQVYSTSTPPSSVTLTSAPSSGDLLIATADGNVQLAANTGWTLVDSINATDWQHVAARLCDGTDTSTLTPFVFAGGSGACAISVVTYRSGVGFGATVAGAQETRSTIKSDSNATKTSNTVDPADGNHRLLFAWAGSDGNRTVANGLIGGGSTYNGQAVTLRGNQPGGLAGSGVTIATWDAIATIAAGTITCAITFGVADGGAIQLIIFQEVAGGAAVPLAAAPAAVSTVAGALNLAVTLAAAPAAVSTLAGALNVAVSLAAAPAAVSTVAADLTNPKPLAAVVAGVSTVAGALNVVEPLAATVAADSTVAGALSVEVQLAAAPAAASTVAGALGVAVSLAATVASVSTVAGDLTVSTGGVAVPLAAVVAAESTTAGALNLAVSLAATVTAVSTVAGELVVAVSLVAASSAVSDATATLNTLIALSAASLAVSAVAGHLSVVQLGRPVADFGTAAWHDQLGGTTALYAALSEVSPDDATYIEGPDATLTPSEQKVRIAALGDPVSSAGHVLRYRYEKDTAAGDSVNLTVTLYAADGTTVIASQQHTGITDTVTAGTLTLSGAEADAIPSADYATGLVVGFSEVKA
jgi:hypothetical protein